MLTEAPYIPFSYFTGEFISYFIDGFILGSVVRMALLLSVLAFKKTKPEKVKRLFTVLTQNMGLFSAPVGVGLIDSFGIISEYQAVLLIVSVVSIILAAASATLVQQELEEGKQTTDNLAHSEVFTLTSVIDTYLASSTLYKKVHINLLCPLLTTILVIIVVLEALGIQYESFQQSSHLTHSMLGPSVVALGCILCEQTQYLRGSIVPILTSVLVGAIIGIVSVIIIDKLMGTGQVLTATPQPEPVTIPIAMGIAEKAGGIPLLTAVIVVVVGIFGNIVGPIMTRVLGVDSYIAKGLALGVSSHGVGTTATIRIGAIEGALSGLVIGLMGIMATVLVPVIRSICDCFSV